MKNKRVRARREWGPAGLEEGQGRVEGGGFGTAATVSGSREVVLFRRGAEGGGYPYRNHRRVIQIVPSNAKILMWFSAVCIASGAKRRAMLFLIQLEATSKWAPPVTGLHVKQELDLL